MFEDLDELAARLLNDAPAQDDPCQPVLDPDGTTLDRLVALARVIAAAQAETMLLQAGLADRATTWHNRHDPRWEAPAPADLVAAEIAPALHLAQGTAAMHVNRAVEIVTRLPLTLAVFRRGGLDLGRVLAILDATMALTAADAGEVERLVLDQAPDQTAGELRSALGKAVIRVDPTAAERRRKEAVKGRRVTRYHRPDGMSALEAVLSAVDTGEIYDLIDEIARQMKTHGDTRSMDERRADALVIIITGREPHLGPEDPPPPADPPPGDDPPDPADHQPAGAEPTDQDAANDGDESTGPGADRDDPGPVEPDDLDERDPPDRISERAALALSAMTRRRTPRPPWVAINQTTNPDGAIMLVGELQGYGPITADYAHHLLSAGAARAPDPPSGRTPTPAQATRHDPPDWLADEVKARDGTCRFPGCKQPAHRVDLDHTIEHPHGLTVRGNLGGLCRRHHRIKGSGCWQVTQHHDGIYKWTSTITGRTYTTYPRGTTGDWRGTTTRRPGRAG